MSAAEGSDVVCKASEKGDTVSLWQTHGLVALRLQIREQ